MAKQDVTGYQAYAEQLAAMLKGNRRLLRTFWKANPHSEGRPGVASARGGFLAEVAKRFGISKTEFSYIKARHAL
jgi:DnaJ like chaperone protein